MTGRILAALFGAVLLGVLVPVLSWLLFEFPETLTGFVWLGVAGVVVGALLGALFPRVFRFVFEVFTDT